MQYNKGVTNVIRLETTIANAKNDCKIAKATYDRLSATLVCDSVKGLAHMHH